MKKNGEAGDHARDNRRSRSVLVAVLLILVVLLSAGSGLYAGASFFAQQAPNVTITTTIFTTTSWTTSTIWSIVTSVVYGVWKTVQYTTSTSTVTVTAGTTYRTAKIVTANGNAHISTAQSKFGGTSGLFDGTGDYLSLADSADWYFGSGDFTIDFWARFSAATSSGLIGQYVDSNNWWTLSLGSGGNLVFYWKDSGTVRAYYVTSTWTASTNTWYHIALVRSGSNLYMFVGGTSQSLTVNIAIGSNSLGDAASTLRIGYDQANGFYMNGWLDEFRISYGIARWTSNFTPPTAAYTGDSSTVLLLHMDGADGSTTFTDDATG